MIAGIGKRKQVDSTNPWTFLGQDTFYYKGKLDKTWMEFVIGLALSLFQHWWSS